MEVIVDSDFVLYPGKFSIFPMDYGKSSSDTFTAWFSTDDVESVWICYVHDFWSFWAMHSLQNLSHYYSVNLYRISDLVVVGILIKYVWCHCWTMNV